MIAVRIPEEIRKYKEKIAFGLTVRQLICTLATLFICVPLYWFGRDYIPEDILAWIIIGIAVPLEAVGFIKINGMPMEKYAVAAFKFEVLYPRKRKFKTENIWRNWQNIAIKEEMPKGFKEKSKYLKRKKEMSLEQTFLLMEAEGNGTLKYSTDPDAEKVTDYDIESQKLLTVRTGGNDKNPKKGRKDKSKIKKKTKLQIKAEEIEDKIKNNPQYIRTKKDEKILIKWKLLKVKRTSKKKQRLWAREGLQKQLFLIQHRNQSLILLIMKKAFLR